MNFDFEDIYVSRNLQFSIGIERNMSKEYISFLHPTNSRRSDYEVYYWLPKSHVKHILNNLEIIHEYVEECRNGLHEDMLIV